MKRDSYMDFLKGLAILLVVVGHSITNDSDMIGLFNFIYSFHMPLLIFISGYIEEKHAAKYEKYGYGIMLKKRTVSLLMPYLSWSVISCLKVVLYEADYPFLLRSLMGYEQSGLWFLAVLFILKCMHFLFWTLDKYINIKNKMIFEIGIVVLLWGGILWLSYYTKLPYLVNTVSYAISYFAGVLLIREERLQKYIFNKYVIAGCLIGYGIGINYFSFYNAEWQTQVLRILLSGLVIIIALNMEKYVKSNHIIKCLGYLGTYSLQIYLLHNYFIDYHNSFEQIDSCLIKGSLHFIMALLVSALCVLIGKIIQCSEILNRVLFGNAVNRKEANREA